MRPSGMSHTAPASAGLVRTISASSHNACITSERGTPRSLCATLNGAFFTSDSDAAAEFAARAVEVDKSRSGRARAFVIILTMMLSEQGLFRLQMGKRCAQHGG